MAVFAGGFLLPFGLCRDAPRTALPRLPAAPMTAACPAASANGGLYAAVEGRLRPTGAMPFDLTLAQASPFPRPLRSELRPARPPPDRLGLDVASRRSMFGTVKRVSTDVFAADGLATDAFADVLVDGLEGCPAGPLAFDGPALAASDFALEALVRPGRVDLPFACALGGDFAGILAGSAAGLRSLPSCFRVAARLALEDVLAAFE